MSARPSRCPRWCDYRHGLTHPKAHVGHVGDVTTDRAAIVAVTVESGDPHNPRPVLHIGKQDTTVELALTWHELASLSHQLVRAARKFGASA